VRGGLTQLATDYGRDTATARKRYRHPIEAVTRWNGVPGHTKVAAGEVGFRSGVRNANTGLRSSRKGRASMFPAPEKALPRRRGRNQ
jgi:hypothetical protein